MALGLLSHSRGDIDALRQGLALIKTLGCERVLFLGERYHDFDALLPSSPPPRIDSDLDFLNAVSDFMQQQDQGKAETRDEKFLGLSVLRLPERDCPAYETQAKLGFDLLEGTIVLAVAHKGDLEKDDIRNASIIVHGSAETPELVQIGPRAFLCPGALDSPEGLIGCLRSSAGAFVFSIYNLKGELLEQRPFSLRRTTKISVK